MQNTYSFNQTPIRTSISYNINDIKLDNVSLPTQKKPFETVTMTKENVTLSNVQAMHPLTYGAGQVLQENMALYCNSAYVVSPDAKDANFSIAYDFDENNAELSNYLQVEADKDMCVTLVFRSQTETPGFHQCILKVHVKNQAKVHVEVVNLLNEYTDHFLSIENIVEENATLDMLFVDMGGKNSISNVYSNVVGEKGEVRTQTAYIGQNQTLKDMNYIAHLRGKECGADMELQGVLSDKAKKNLKFTIDFKQGCTGAVGKEMEACMLLSKDVRYRALPILLCAEDNVEGAHSAAAGQVDPEQLFYIMSRGFTKKEAIKMLVRAKYNKIIAEIHDHDLQQEIVAQLDRRL